MKDGWRKFWMCLAFAAVVVGTMACATTESENASARPWNSPRGWEHGLPSSFYEGR